MRALDADNRHTSETEWYVRTKKHLRHAHEQGSVARIADVLHQEAQQRKQALLIPPIQGVEEPVALHQFTQDRHDHNSALLALWGKCKSTVRILVRCLLWTKWESSYAPQGQNPAQQNI